RLQRRQPRAVLFCFLHWFLHVFYLHPIGRFQSCVGGREDLGAGPVEPDADPLAGGAVLGGAGDRFNSADAPFGLASMDHPVSRAPGLHPYSSAAAEALSAPSILIRLPLSPVNGPLWPWPLRRAGARRNARRSPTSAARSIRIG